MVKFSSEDTPLPITNGVTNAIKETIMAQFYRALSSDPGHKLTVNSTTQQLLPTNAFNVRQSLLGFGTFTNGNQITINKTATYSHEIFVNAYSTIPVNGIVAVDIIDSNNTSYNVNVFATKNITPTSAEALILTCIIPHKVGDTCRLRFGGGEVPVVPAGLNFLGNWATAIFYVVNDLVIWQVTDGGDDGFYKCIVNVTGAFENPGDATYWLKVANAPGSNLELNITSVLWKILEK